MCAVLSVDEPACTLSPLASISSRFPRSRRPPVGLVLLALGPCMDEALAWCANQPVLFRWENNGVCMGPAWGGEVAQRAATPPENRRSTFFFVLGKITSLQVPSERDAGCFSDTRSALSHLFGRGVPAAVAVPRGRIATVVVDGFSELLVGLLFWGLWSISTGAWWWRVRMSWGVGMAHCVWEMRS